MKPTDSDDWFEALAGRPSAEADPAVTAEATLLREALQRWPSASPTLTATQAEAGRAALLAAARRDPRVVERRGCTLCQAVGRLFAGPRLAGALALATLAWLAILVGPWHVSNPPPSGADPADATLRGSPQEGVQRLQAADPRALREQIVAELARVGVTATRYERNGRHGLDAELPRPPAADVLALLRRHGLAAPPSGGLAVEVEPKAAP